MARGRKTGGRKPGVPNRATADVRACIALVAEGFAPEVHALLQRGAKEDPLGAVDTFARLIEYHIPKLARTEITGKDGGPVEVKSTPPDEAL